MKEAAERTALKGEDAVKTGAEAAYCMNTTKTVAASQDDDEDWQPPFGDASRAWSDENPLRRHDGGQQDDEEQTRTR